MEVTNQNFHEILPSVKEAIYECDFLAIDTELTGLFSKDSVERGFDSTDENYLKLKEISSQFLIIQFGLSTFKYHPEKERYFHKDFNFYIFPRLHSRQSPDVRFLCQASSVLFLAENSFDFNKWIHSGISYLTYAQEEELKSHITKKYKIERNSVTNPVQNANGCTVIPEEHKGFIANVKNEVESFISNKSEKTLDLQPCSGYQRKLIYENLLQKHRSGLEVHSKTNDDNQKYISISKCSSEDKLKLLQIKENSDMDDLNAAVGFRKVIEYISESKKLVVGHNMYLDVMHIIRQFFFPLPPDLKEFKSMVRMTFPRLIDTKHLAQNAAIKNLIESSVLEELFKTSQSKEFGLPNLSPAEGFKCYGFDGGQPHEAGYDAFMTGICCLSLSKKISTLQSKPNDKVGASSKLLSPYINRFYIMRNHFISSMNLSGADPILKRDHVFYVSFPSEWKTVDLVELFLPYGNIQVNWLNDVSALVTLKNAENAIAAKTGLVNKPSKAFTVQTFAQYQASAMKALNLQPGSATTKQSDGKTLKESLKARNSSNTESAGSVDKMEVIREDENEAECSTSAIDFVQPPPKKLKKSGDEQHPVVESSTLFDENKDW